MDDVIERLERLESAIEALRADMERQTGQLARNHALILELVDLVSRPESDGGLTPLLEALIVRLGELAGASERIEARIEALLRESLKPR